MKLLCQITILLIGVTLVACSKNNNSPSDALAGTWIFTNQLTQSSFPAPSLTNISPSVTTSFTVSNDSIQVTFDGNGNYTFLNFRLPADKGTYTIVRDSLLVIQSDTTGFVKFNYTLPVVTFSGTVPPTPIIIPGDPSTYPVYAPYANFHFVSDTILFRKTAGNAKINFSGTWVTTQAPPVGLSTNDTLVLNQCTNYFTRQ